MERFFQEASPARIFLHHLRNAVTGVGYIATPATTDPYLAQQLAAFFNDGHFQQRVEPCCVHRAEKACSATANNDQAFFIHAGKGNAVLRTQVAVRFFCRLNFNEGRKDIGLSFTDANIMFEMRGRFTVGG